MRILITGICGFVGSELARSLAQHIEGVEIFGIDNLIRAGSEMNRLATKKSVTRFFHGDVRNASDFEQLPQVDWLIDAAANPSVLAGIDGRTSSRQLVEHNLLGTLNMLEFCKRVKAGFALVSTSRVYSVEALAKIPVRVVGNAFALDETNPALLGAGCSREGISTEFSTTPPLSLYGSSKLASELLAIEYGSVFGLPVIIDRCGVLAGGGQFGTADQGIFSYWLRSYALRRPMKYIGFNGTGAQVRDALHPKDLAALLVKQLAASTTAASTTAPGTATVWNVGGGRANSMSLAQLSEWCKAKFGEHAIQPATEARRWDAPWVVMDSRAVMQKFGWQPQISLQNILDEIADHHLKHVHFLELSDPS